MIWPPFLQELVDRASSPRAAFTDSDEPIRAELFSIERLEQHAESLAAAQRVTADPGHGRPLAPRIRDNARALLESYRSLAQAIREERVVSPAAEWLVDNFHIVDEQVREIRDHLPSGFYRELPKLAEGHLAGYPRVLGIAWAFVAHTDSRFDIEALGRFVRAYQRVQPLQIGELWAVAITLRIVLVENLRRLAERICHAREDRQRADALANGLLGLGGRPVSEAAATLGRLDRSSLPRSFTVQLVQRLREQDPAVVPALHWLDELLAAQGMTTEEIVREEHEAQAAMNVTVRNVITSMRLMSALDWKDFFESVSLVDEILHTKTAFLDMDFATRDRYRHAIEQLARRSGHTEIDVAKRAVARTEIPAADDPTGRRRDPGYHLIAGGRPAFERELGFRPGLRRRLLRAYVAAGTTGYLGTIAILSLLIVTPPLLIASHGGAGLGSLLLFGLLALFPAADLAIALTNRGVVERIRPAALPKLALRDGVPSDLRTMVVVPTLLTTVADVEAQLDRLEIHSLANSDAELRFALVSDWMDAAAEEMPEDDALIAAARADTARLNHRHGPAPDGSDRFFLFHRRRTWNPREGVWMGWERKRGKLHELDRLLRGATDTSFLPFPGRIPDGVRYIITLDADTRLPSGSARQLVGTMAHPLNRPRLDPGTHRVVEGYGLLQPRITPTLPEDGEGSLYQRIFSGPSGIDPYASATSDVYQDLFGEGSYTGKGIYDVDAFEAALDARVPENSLLSHDLFEGLFARAGLLTDVSLFEEFPSNYLVSAARQHRWARGDWQLLPWLVGWTSAPLSVIGRWKMLDNLRRTLLPLAVLLLLVAGWTLPVGSPKMWTTFVLTSVILAALVPVLHDVVPRRSGISKRSHVRAVASDLAVAAAQVSLTFTLLAHQAWLMADAIGRAVVRLLVTRRHLLEWVTAAQAKAGQDLSLATFLRRMGGAIALAIVAAALVLLHGRPTAAPWAFPVIGLWLFSPLLGWWISLPQEDTGAEPLGEDDARTLRKTARRTWHFFETFVGAEDHALPPDNFQEDPHPVVAHRTSPTNIGLYLLSTFAAHDFGWLGILDTLDRVGATIDTLNDLERFRGHFYNWYETRERRPLDPRYVSTVDSGNLLGHLLAMAEGCRELCQQPLLGAGTLSGIADTLLVLQEILSGLADDRRTLTVTRRNLSDAMDAVMAALMPIPETVDDWGARISQLEPLVDTMTDIARTLAAERDDPGARELATWSEAVRAVVASHARDLDMLVPWARLPRERGALPEPGIPVPSPAGASDVAEALLARVADRGAETPLVERLERSASACASLARRLDAMARLATAMAGEMDFRFLFDPSRNLLRIGYRVSDGEPDPNYYDLLASEARLASFVAIAKGDVPASHWFQLGRTMTPVGRGSALVSWSGSMFEYLMPALVMRSPAGSLLEQTCELVVRRQMQYGAERHVPWGISESAYNVRGLDLTYQYSSFGVPGLGLERGLSEDLVIAPYATALASMVDAAAAARNFIALAAAGGLGPYGFYEALDYTPSRVPEGSTVAPVRAYMAHHMGMTLVAALNVLHDGVMRHRFHAAPSVQANDLLLQERTPRDVGVSRPRADEVNAAPHVRDFVPPVQRRVRSPHGPVPHTHLLSNGRYAVMLTAAGSGYSHCRELAVTRWREDVTRDCWGQYIFLRDTQRGEVWSAGYQPSGINADAYEAVFAEDRAEIHRRDGAISTTMEVVVSPEDDAEVRRISVTNLGVRTREIEVTSYAEVVLAPPATDAAHPVFSNLFVQTEFVPDVSTLLATRRPRSPDEAPVWAAHVVVVEGETVGGAQYETDRARFLGRGRGIRTPMSVVDGRPLSNTTGAVLDPIFSLRYRVRLAAGASAHLTFSTLVSSSREAALDLADKYHDPSIFERAATLAWTRAQVELHHLRIEPSEAHLFQRLASRILYSDRSLRPSQEVMERNAGGQSGLWAYGISGDLPIVLVRIDEAEDQEIVRQLLRAHEYWRMKQLAVDLVILNEKAVSYAQDLQNSLETLVRASSSGQLQPGETPRGSVFVLRAENITAQDRDLLQTAARARLLSRQGTLAEQVMRMEPPEPGAPPPLRTRSPAPPDDTPPPKRPELEFFNGLGGFTPDGKHYVTILGEGQWTPTPWINVVTNGAIGFQVSECGAGYTWAVNSRENQLTPWSNDPVSDQPGEIFYVRDEETGELWGPTALPIREEHSTYLVHHGPGFSRFEHASHGMALDLLQLVPLDDPVKISRLALENRSGRARRLSVTAYVEWVLGDSRSANAPFVVTAIDEQTGALLAHNTWHPEFGGRVAFVDLAGRQTAWTGDRAEFLGRNGTPDHPAALERPGKLSGQVGAGFDPCGALQTSIELRPGDRAEVVLLMGQGATVEEARVSILRYRSAPVDAVLRTVATRWDDILSVVQVRTPDRSMDVMLNSWLLYQALACRVWARAAFYQASGAYGFRDQLQDVMAITLARRDLAREHLLRAASRQFVEGDVQHWWHPPSGRGTRTRISDDLVWLPYAAIHYLETTGDMSLLDEVVPFLEGPVLAPDQHEAYFAPTVSSQTGTFFEHCARALDARLRVGSHGLPLMGTGDWNDGMNRVGPEGRGESVWLGWFLHTSLWEFARLADLRGETKRAAAWRQHVNALKAALERAWDGDWYRRAYFDDGTPLGSVSNAECRIDSIAQSWGVISGAALPARAERAMAAVEEYLVHRGDGLVLLFAPPFDQTPLDPGYIKGYLPGVRENGGQYTHAAIWAVLAFAALGDGDKAGELFAILNPINHASTRAGVHRYKVEPYVSAADVYAAAPHVGRGGWTWYTGSAGWMYRAGVEWILGFRLRGTVLHLDPCIPRAWRGFEVNFRYHSSRYEIRVANPRGVTRGVSSVEIDGQSIGEVAGIPLADDGATHQVHLVLG